MICANAHNATHNPAVSTKAGKSARRHETTHQTHHREPARHTQPSSISNSAPAMRKAPQCSQQDSQHGCQDLLDIQLLLAHIGNAAHARKQRQPSSELVLHTTEHMDVEKNVLSPLAARTRIMRPMTPKISEASASQSAGSSSGFSLRSVSAQKQAELAKTARWQRLMTESPHARRHARVSGLHGRLCDEPSSTGSGRTEFERFRQAGDQIRQQPQRTHGVSRDSQAWLKHRPVVWTDFSDDCIS